MSMFWIGFLVGLAWTLTKLVILENLPKFPEKVLSVIEIIIIFSMAMICIKTSNWGLFWGSMTAAFAEAVVAQIVIHIIDRRAAKRKEKEA